MQGNFNFMPTDFLRENNSSLIEIKHHRLSRNKFITG